ncbi:MAG TPA: FAD-dependent oxidoreductase [Candidatus Polarisedimenticolaceae bacterium]|nr:FAD-dependent oxidoreductase [Candidatus Polarisedimenticolaceae bacterium]
MPATDVDVLVLGAGAAGLACRYALSGRRDVVCLEAAEEVGGLLRMFRHGDFTFDTTLHVLPSRSAMAGTILESLIGDEARAFPKRNLVWQRGRVIDYPYQFNSHALPHEVREECLAGLPAARRDAPSPDRRSFEVWLLDQFGPGFYRHFFEPYNRKLYGVDPSELEAAPMTWTIPADNREAALRGARAPHPGGAVVECTYPTGLDGIHVVPKRLAERGTGEILLGERVTRVDLDARTAWTARGKIFHYRDMVSTLPLPTLLRCVEGLPASIADWSVRLHARPVTNIRVAIARSGDGLPGLWTYFPDPEIPFYRLSRLSSISPDLMPPGAEACLLECAGDDPVKEETIVALCRELGVAGDGDVRVAGSLVIPHAYVLFKHGHRDGAEAAIRYLAERGVRVAGRYGCWAYSNIAQTLDTGLRAAAELM